MKLLNALTLGLLPLSVLAAKKASTADRFDQLHAQQRASGALKLDEASYIDVVRAPRNHSAAILLTAKESRFGCSLCKEFQPEWELLAKSWVNGDKAGDSRVVFGTLDFADGKAAFQQLQLQTVPVLVLYGPTVGEHAKPAGEPDRWSFSDGYVRLIKRSCRGN
jgi:oligosaccharyltransferase complex subunit gamma